MTVAPWPWNRPAREKPSDLSPDDLREALRVHNPQLVGEVFAFAKGIVAEEQARQGRIDAKANMLLGAIGVSVTVATTLLPRTKHLGTGLVLGAAAIVALAAGACALSALRVMRYGRVSDQTVFNASILETADAESGTAVATYQRYILPALWETHVGYVRANDERARIVSVGQKLFFAALAIGLVGGVLLAVWQ